MRRTSASSPRRSRIRRATWTTFIAHNPAVKIEGLTCFAHHLVAWEKEGGLDYLRVIDMTSGDAHRLETDEPDRTIAPGANPEFDTSVLRFTYESMVSPPSVYEYDMTTRARTLLKQQPVLGGYEPSDYEGRRIWITARDGVRVPISLVYRKGTPQDGTAPLAAVWLWRLRHLADADVQLEPTEPARSRRRVRHRVRRAEAASSAKTGAIRAA